MNPNVLPGQSFLLGATVYPDDTKVLLDPYTRAVVGENYSREAAKKKNYEQASQVFHSFSLLNIASYHFLNFYSSQPLFMQQRRNRLFTWFKFNLFRRKI